MDGEPSTTQHSGYCADCGAALDRRYCGDCGQRHPAHRLSLGHIVREIPHAIFHVDHGLLPTLSGLALRPGITINAYLNGRRKRFTNPLTMLLLMTGAYALATALSSPDHAANAPTAGTAQAFLRILSDYLLLALGVQLPITALTTRLLFHRSGRAYGEHLATHAYIFAFTCAIGASVLPLRWVLEPWQYATVFYLGNAGYQIWAIYATFTGAERHRGLRLLKAALAVALYSALNTLTLWTATAIYARLTA